MKKNNSYLITATIAVLAIYNLLYWASKTSTFFQGFHKEVIGHWKLITFLEFLALASILVDMIVRWDTFAHTEKRVRFAITAALCILFMLKLVMGVIELYMRGGVS